MKVWDLFSGIGGFSLGLHRTGGFETTLFVEIEDYPQKVLRKNFPGIPIHDDIRTLRPKKYERPDLLVGGYPCQPFSVAGKQLAEEDERHLWPEMYRIVRAVRPRWVVCENVYGHIKLGLDTVISQLEAIEYRVWVFVVPACAVGAPHRRDRVWILANSTEQGLQGAERQEHEGRGKRSSQCGSLGDTQNERYKQWSDAEREGAKNKQEQRLGVRSEPSGSSEDVADTNQQGSQGYREPGECGGELFAREGSTTEHPGWEPDPGICRVAHGIPNRVHRLKCLGNAIVPQIAEIIGKAIIEYEEARSALS